MNSGGTLEAVEAAEANEPRLAAAPMYDEKAADPMNQVLAHGLPDLDAEAGGGGVKGSGPNGDFPTDEDLHTLRRISGEVPWAAYTVAVIELCERFSYYGTTAVCMLPFLPFCFALRLEGANGVQRRSREFHSAAPAARVQYRCWLRRPIGCSEYGSASVDRTDDLQVSPSSSCCALVSGQ